MRFIDLTGKKFGRLIVIKKDKLYLEKNKRKRIRWECKCECGNKTTTRAYNLVTGKTRSCGCIKVEILKNGLRQKLTEEQKTISRLKRKKHQRNYLLNKLFKISLDTYNDMLDNIALFFDFDIFFPSMPGRNNECKIDGLL